MSCVFTYNLMTGGSAMGDPLRLSRSIPRVLLGAIAIFGCSRRAPAADAHADHATPSVGAAGASSVNDVSIPAGANAVAERLAKSPRHGEFVTIRTGPSDSVRA